jgi:hypothetical protein
VADAADSLAEEALEAPEEVADEAASVSEASSEPLAVEEADPLEAEEAAEKAELELLLEG